jgi:hypothetical protein
VSTAPILAAFLLAAILVAGACSRGPGGAAASVRSASAVAGNTENPCVSDLGPRDVADILGSSGVGVKAVANNAEACRFEGPDDTGMVMALRSGDEVEPFWKLTVTQNNDRMLPMAGVGDEALRLPDGSEVMARKGALSCQADVVGMDAVLAKKSINGNRDRLARKLGALCNKVFAARRA